MGFQASTLQVLANDVMRAPFTFSTKVLNIQDFDTSVTPKVEVHLGIIGLSLLHSPPLVKMCLILEHTLLASCAFVFHIQLRTRCYDCNNLKNQSKKGGRGKGMLIKSQYLNFTTYQVLVFKPYYELQTGRRHLKWS